DDGEARLLLLQHLQRGAAVLGLQHVEALVGQHPAQRVPDLRLVIHHQDRFRHVLPPQEPYAPRRARATRWAGRLRTGNSRTNRVPCGGLSRTRMKPLWSATIAETIASPSPVPSGLVEKSGAKTRARASGDTPPPC